MASQAARLAAQLRTSAIGPILIATLALFLISPLIASGSVQSSALANMLPFAAVLAIVAVGQTLVVQQGGIDLSVPGTISLAAVLFNQQAGGDDGRILSSILLVLAVCAGIGLVIGVVITRLGVVPLVATLAANALLLGGVQQVSGGVPSSAPLGWSEFASSKALGIPVTVIVAVCVVAVVGIVVKRTVAGRSFEATGANPRAARAAGVRVRRMRLSAYLVASLLYGCAGILLAGFLQTPSLTVGDTYLLASIAATVLGGTPLAGGAGSVVATGIGALFLAQLNQVLASTGATTAVQLLVQGVVIAVSVAITNLDWRALLPRARTREAVTP